MRLFQMVQHYLEVLRLKRHLGLNAVPLREPNAGTRVIFQIAPFLRAGTYAAHRSAYVVQNRRCVTFSLFVEEYLQIGSANVAQAVLREFGRQVSAKNIPVEIACGRTVGRKYSFFPRLGEVSEKHGRVCRTEP